MNNSCSWNNKNKNNKGEQLKWKNIHKDTRTNLRRKN